MKLRSSYVRWYHTSKGGLPQTCPVVVDPGNSRLSRQSSGGKNVSDVVARGGRAVVAVDGYRQLHMMSRCTTDEPDAMDSARGS